MSDEKKERVENSEAFIKLYRTFSAVQTAGIYFVSRGATDKEKIKRAEKIIESLGPIISNIKAKSGSSIQCDGECWDPITQQCVC